MHVYIFIQISDYKIIGAIIFKWSQLSSKSLTILNLAIGVQKHLLCLIDHLYSNQHLGKK